MRIILHLVQVFLLATIGLGSIARAAEVSDQNLRNIWQRGDLHQMQQLAEQGDARAQHWMGLMLHNRGRYDEAIHWYGRAVDQGDGRSADRIANFYEHGIGRPRNLVTAMDWYRKGATLGDFDSQVRYAWALRSGTAVARDERAAFDWFSRAARQPDARAQMGYAYLPLAEMYAMGIGTRHDPRRAYALAKAAELTVDDSDTESLRKARSLQADIGSRLSPSDLRIADRFFRELRPDLAERSTQRSPFRTGGTLLVLVVVAGLIIWRILGRSAPQSSV